MFVYMSAAMCIIQPAVSLMRLRLRLLMVSVTVIYLVWLAQHPPMTGIHVACIKRIPR